MKTLRHLRGVSLIELMTTVSALAITLTLGVPTFTSLQATIQRGQASSELLSSFTMARSEAARRAVPVTVCASSDRLTCDTSQTPNWRNGWIVFTDADMDKFVDSGTDNVIQTVHFDHTAFLLTPECISPGCKIAQGVSFQNSGYPDEGDIGRFRYTDDREYQVLTLSYVGRIELTGSGSGSGPS
ncbi:GspH/FimT family pseudopilin [Candidatus Thiodictyon syntrophicum]|jgi:type IV fimbrial biogenesis protein FimT|uniref:GspH/FimT family pseudopilin n=1 Tax=Candidatus Thiodictyon syntrophicum TaxID=1166950 RepID=UPI001EFFB61B|nr:GspH/FimT family pseudopilin [Candidatus Thiodictyon syntrophicum]